MNKSKPIQGYEMLHISKIIQQNQMDPRNIVSLVKTNRNYRVCVESGLEYHDFILPIIPAPKPPKRKPSTHRKPTAKSKRKKSKIPPLGEMIDTFVNFVFITTIFILIICWMTAGK